MFNLSKNKADVEIVNSRLNELKNKDGLTPCTHIIRDFSDGHLRLHLGIKPEITLYPSTHVSGVAELLAENDEYWKNSSIDVTASPSLVAGAPIFGVPLKKAFDQAMKNGLQKSRFALPREPQDHRSDYMADLLIFVSKDRKLPSNVREIEIWEDAPIIEEIFYCHGLIDIDAMIFKHLDGAKIWMSPEDKKYLFENATKIKGEKRKYFRSDAKIPLSLGLEIMRSYFLVEELVDEAFELREYAKHE